MRNWNHCFFVFPLSPFSVASLPMRNWNMPKAEGQSFAEKLRAYLWGIETIISWWKSWENTWLRAYLWGIETFEVQITIQSNAQLRAYLWGIETLPVSINFLPVLVLRAYLWGIETLYLPHMRHFLSSCEPTYEELKHIQYHTKNSWMWRCEPTYEELKLFLPFFNCQIWLCCEPTYEELKLSPVFSFLNQINQVASLPMRNWNKYSLLRSIKFFKVASLPMRNWNSAEPDISILNPFGCEPTYEELKLL